MEAFMSSIGALKQVAASQGVGTGRVLGLHTLLAEYRSAVAAEASYERLRCGSAMLPHQERAPSAIARQVFDRFYSGKFSRSQSGTGPTRARKG